MLRVKGFNTVCRHFFSLPAQMCRRYFQERSDVFERKNTYLHS